MNSDNGFYTLKGYAAIEPADITFAMEDYLEMICRVVRADERVTVRLISDRLHVKPPSVTKMLRHLDEAGYIHAEKYGYITLTEKGITEGKYLLYRHETVLRFLCELNGSDNELEQTEKIEHFLDRRTVENLGQLTKMLSGTGKQSVKKVENGK